MKYPLIYMVIAALTVSIIHGCGPDEEELQRQREAEEQARLDSLEQVWEAEMEEMRRDSLRQAREDSIARAEAEREAQEQEERERAEAIRYQADGSFTVQVRSWRSEERAEEHATMWKQRGFEHAYVQKYGDEDVGDVWFRVRLGNVASYTMAQRLQEKVRQEHQAAAWIASVGS